MPFNPYLILGLPVDAADAQIRQAYRRAAKRCHPDAGGTHAAMIEVIAAWEILSNPSKRAVYDQQNAQPQNPQAQAQWSDIAEEAHTAAKVAVPKTAKDWSEFMRWLDTASADLQGNVLGRFASGALSGVVLGVCLGMLSGWLLGIGVAAGAGVGFFLGGLGGGFATVWRRAASA